MAYSFQKCCFDSEKIGLVKEFDRMFCILNESHNFDVFFHRNNDESFYCLNRKQLKEYWQCVQEDRKSFCPEHCDKCLVCDEHAPVFENLLDSYFFGANKDKHQSVLWKVFFEHGNKQRKFRIEIAKTTESEHLVLDYGSAC